MSGDCQHLAYTSSASSKYTCYNWYSVLILSWTWGTSWHINYLGVIYSLWKSSGTWVQPTLSLLCLDQSKMVIDTELGRGRIAAVTFRCLCSIRGTRRAITRPCLSGNWTACWKNMGCLLSEMSTRRENLPWELSSGLPGMTKSRLVVKI